MDEANMYYNILSASWELINCPLQFYVQCDLRSPKQEGFEFTMGGYSRV